MKQQKRNQEKKKKKNTNKLKLNQCPHCDHWFSSTNGTYGFHLTQCQIVQESTNINIYQESHDTKKAVRVPQQQYSSHSALDSGCFTNRLSRIDLKYHYNRGGEGKINDPSLEYPGIEHEELKSSIDIDIDTDTHANAHTIEITEDSYQLYEKAWVLFDTAAAQAHRSNVHVQLCHIPFPPNSLSSDGLCALYGLEPETPLDLKRARLRKLLMRW